MADRIEKAVKAFDCDSCNCSQAIARVFGPEVGLEDQAAMGAGMGFGGGVGRQGLVCGALTGAVLVLGCKANAEEPNPVKAMDLSFRLVETFMQRFRERHGSVNCKDLLGVDLATEEGRRTNQEQGLTRTVCPNFVRSAAQILDEMI